MSYLRQATVFYTLRFACAVLKFLFKKRYVFTTYPKPTIWRVIKIKPGFSVLKKVM